MLPPSPPRWATACHRRRNTGLHRHRRCRAVHLRSPPPHSVNHAAATGLLAPSPLSSASAVQAPNFLASAVAAALGHCVPPPPPHWAPAPPPPPRRTLTIAAAAQCEPRRCHRHHGAALRFVAMLLFRVSALLAPPPAHPYPRHSLSSFISPPPTLSLSFNFVFQLLEWPVGRNSLSISPAGPPRGPGRARATCTAAG